MADDWQEYEYQDARKTKVKYRIFSKLDGVEAITVTMPEDFIGPLFASTKATGLVITLDIQDSSSIPISMALSNNQDMFEESLPEAHPEKFKSFTMTIVGFSENEPLYLSYGYPMFYYAGNRYRPKGWYTAGAPVIPEKIMEKPYPNRLWRYEKGKNHDLPFIPGIPDILEPIMSKPYPNHLYRYTRGYNNDIPYLPVWPDLEPLDKPTPPPADAAPNDDHEFIDILDWVHVISRPHGLDDYYPVTKMSIPLTNPADTSITLNYDTTISLSSTLNKTNTELLDKLNQVPNESAILSAARNTASELIRNGTKGYVTMHYDEETGICDEILISDKPLKTKKDYEDKTIHVWRWNRGGLGYSNNGYSGDFNTAINSNGQIVANFIAAGTMSGDRILGGTLALGGKAYENSKGGNGQLRVYDNQDRISTHVNADGITTVGHDPNAGNKYWALRLTNGDLLGGEVSLDGQGNETNFQQFGGVHPNVYLGAYEENVKGLWLEGTFISITPDHLGVATSANKLTPNFPAPSAKLTVQTQNISIPSGTTSEDSEEEPESRSVTVVTDIKYDGVSILNNGGLDFTHGIVTSNPNSK